MSKQSNAFDWNPELITIHKLAWSDPDHPDQGLERKELTRTEGFPDAEDSFLDYLDYQLREIIKKKPDTGANSACKVYQFVDNSKGAEDRSLVEDELIMATDIASFSAGIEKLLERVMAVPGVGPGIIVAMKLAATFGEGETGGSFVTFFWIDSEEAARLKEDPLGIDDLGDCLIRKPCRGFIYPFLAGDTPRHDLVKLHSKPASHPFTELLAIFPPPTTEELLQKEVARAIFSIGKEPEAMQEQYEGYFEKTPAKKRELFGEERLVKVADLLPERTAAAVARESSRTAKDLYDKDQKMKITIDGMVKVDLKLENLGESFFFAQEGQERFLVIRGRSFLSNKSQLSPLDFLRTDSLQQVFDKVSA